MKQIIPFKKELEFKNNVAEVTSISLEHDLSLKEDHVLGELTLSGSYKITDTSINVENFEFKLPIDITISDRYDVSKLKIDIDDFYYEIIDNSLLSVSIDIALDNLEELPVEVREEPMEILETKEEVEELKEEVKEKKSTDRIEVEEVKNLFNSFDDDKDTYSTYKVCIVKEGDTIESIVLKYSVTKEVLEQYNDLSNIKIGDKVIIPTIYDARV